LADLYEEGYEMIRMIKTIIDWLLTQWTTMIWNYCLGLEVELRYAADGALVFSLKDGIRLLN
jgi:hypothetical protein